MTHKKFENYVSEAVLPSTAALYCNLCQRHSGNISMLRHFLLLPTFLFLELSSYCIDRLGFPLTMDVLGQNYTLEGLVKCTSHHFTVALESNIVTVPYKSLQQGHSAVRSMNTQLNLNFVALIILQTVCVLLLVNLTQVSNRINLSFIAISFNVMSPAPKINELAHVVLNADFALVCITEIWLQKHIPDSIVTMQGYNLIHLDRSEAVHRGVCVFLNEMIPFNILDDFTDKTYGLEVLWKKNQTNLTPKGILWIYPWPYLSFSRRKQLYNVRLFDQLFVRCSSTKMYSHYLPYLVLRWSPQRIRITYTI